MSRDEKLKANQRRLAAQRRAKKLAEAKKKQTKKGSSSAAASGSTRKPKTNNAIKTAYQSGNNFGSMLKDKSKRNGAGVRTPLSGGAGGTRPPQQPKKDPPKQTTPPRNSGGTYGRPLPSNPQLKSQPGGSGTYGRPLPSNPQLKSQKTDPESGVSMNAPSSTRTSKDGKYKMMGGKLYVKKNGKWVKARM